MSILKDVLEIFKEIKDSDYLDLDDSGNYNLGSFGRKNSLSRFTDESILQFPVLTSSSLSVEDLTMINKALERQFATFAMIAMNINNIEFFDSHTEASKTTFIRRFHTNSNRGISTGGALQYVNTVLSDSVQLDKLYHCNSKLLKEYVSDLRVKPLNDLTKSKSLLKEELSNYDAVANTPNDTKLSSSLSPSLMDNDAKKANEMIPTLIKVPIFFTNKETGSTFTNEAIVGIKCITHLIPTEEMTYNIAKGIEEKRSFFRFIQWTSGEIKFFKDYLFCIDRIKKEAISSKTNSHWWRSLKNRSNIAKLKSYTFAKHTLLPNTTIVITMDEAEYILNNYGIDLINDVKSVRKLIATFFLLGFVIVDSSAEIAYFIFDGETSYQMYSFRSLEKENSNAKRDMKDLMSLANNFR